MFGDDDDDNEQLREQYRRALKNNNPGETMIRQRGKSSKRRDLDRQFEHWTDEEITMMPSLRFQKHSRQKSLKERFDDLQVQHHTDSASRTKTFKERFAELQKTDEVTAGRLATLMRYDSINVFRCIYFKVLFKGSLALLTSYLSVDCYNFLKEIFQ